MLLIILLLLIFWVLVPGLLTGWMLREHGRGFLWGALVGVLFGPAGTLGALVFIFATRRRPVRGRLHEQPRGFHPFYTVPFVGRLHVSTAWSLAGVVAFLCAWMIGGLGYELYTARLRGAATGGGHIVRLEANGQRPTAVGNVAPNQLQQGSKPAGAAQGNNALPAAGQLLSGLAAQAGRVAGGSGSAEGPAVPAGQPGPATPPTGFTEGGPLTPPAAAPPANAPPTPDAPATPPRPPAQARDAAVSEVTRSLGSDGHRVHVAVSGDAQTATLSISGPTLTRQAGNQLLGRARHTLKAAGIRIVVMINGQESWTYIL